MDMQFIFKIIRLECNKGLFWVHCNVVYMFYVCMFGCPPTVVCQMYADDIVIYAHANKKQAA